MKGKREVYEVLDSSVAGLEVGRRYTAAELVKILKPEAEAAMRGGDVEGRRPFRIAGPGGGS
ncbi:hypothetical protein [Sandaracinobacteroides hominis]|uniref:hypothetical protein n=1 Tax=Sandaracinobacteroides hominis TaxID=2780086 RepID=UPI0018F3B4EF|nr:hypothetical protein [Sandaracinobacteroides hominis]